MTDSNEDMDFTQFRGTVLLLQAAVTQMKLSMREGDDSINDLVESFGQLVSKAGNIRDLITELPESEQKKQMGLEFSDLDSNIQGNVIAFQFYDKLTQRIEHIKNGLDMLADLLGNKTRVFNSGEWNDLQDKIKNDFHIDDDKVLFNAIINGATEEEAMLLYYEQKKKTSETGDIDFF